MKNFAARFQYFTAKFLSGGIILGLTQMTCFHDLHFNIFALNFKNILFPEINIVLTFYLQRFIKIFCLFLWKSFIHIGYSPLVSTLIIIHLLIKTLAQRLSKIKLSKIKEKNLLLKVKRKIFIVQWNRSIKLTHRFNIKSTNLIDVVGSKRHYY